MGISSSAFSEKAARGAYFNQSVGFSLNPLGLLFTSHILYRVPLSDKPGILWESTKLDLGFCNELAPAFESPGLFIQYEPVAIFDIAVYCNYLSVFDALGFGYVKLDSYRSQYEPSAINDSAQSNEHGIWVRVAPTIKAKVGKVLFLDAFMMHCFLISRNAFYFEQITHTVLDKTDVVLRNNVFTLYEFSEAFMAGVNYFYQTVPSSGSTTHRLSLTSVYMHKFRNETALSTALVAGTYLKHDYMDYSDPYVALQLEISLKLNKR